MAHCFCIEAKRKYVKFMKFLMKFLSGIDVLMLSQPKNAIPVKGFYHF